MVPGSMNSTAALAAAAVYVGCEHAGLPREIGMIAGFGTGVALRGAGLIWGLSLPRYRPRPGRPSDEI